MLELFSCQLPDLLVWQFKQNVREFFLSPQHTQKTLESQSLLSQDNTDAAPPPAHSAAHLPFHHSQPFALCFIFTATLFQASRRALSTCAGLRAVIPLCSDASDAYLWSRARSCRFSRSLLLTEALCVHALAFLCAGVELPLYSYIDAAVCSSLVLSVSLLLIHCQDSFSRVWLTDRGINVYYTIASTLTLFT